MPYNLYLIGFVDMNERLIRVRSVVRVHPDPPLINIRKLSKYCTYRLIKSDLYFYDEMQFFKSHHHSSLNK